MMVADKLLLTGLLTSLRCLFAGPPVNERNGDFSSADTERDQGTTLVFTAMATGEILFAQP